MYPKPPSDEGGGITLVMTKGEKVVAMYMAIAFLCRNISPSVSYADSSLIRVSHIVRRTFLQPPSAREVAWLVRDGGREGGSYVCSNSFPAEEHLSLSQLR